MVIKGIEFYLWRQNYRDEESNDDDDDDDEEKGIDSYADIKIPTFGMKMEFYDEDYINTTPIINATIKEKWGKNKDIINRYIPHYKAMDRVYC